MSSRRCRGRAGSLCPGTPILLVGARHAPTALSPRAPQRPLRTVAPQVRSRWARTSSSPAVDAWTGPMLPIDKPHTSANRPLVSVVIPAMNAAATVAQAVHSVLDQTVQDFEVIVVDDGSSDATADVVASIPDARVHVVRQPNRGAAAARNAGILSARGNWVAFLDADDLWLPHKLEVQLQALAKRPDARAVQSGAYFVDSDRRVLRVRRCFEPRDPMLAFLRFQNMPNVASTWMVERGALISIGMFDASLAILEDWDISVRIARDCNPISISEPLSMYRVHPGNRSRDLGLHVRPGLRVLRKVFEDPDLPLSIRKRKREIYGRFYTMLCGGALRNADWRACAWWGFRALVAHPRMALYMMGLPARRVRRLRSRWGARDFSASGAASSARQFAEPSAWPLEERRWRER